MSSPGNSPNETKTNEPVLRVSTTAAPKKAKPAKRTTQRNLNERRRRLALLQQQEQTTTTRTTTTTENEPLAPPPPPAPEPTNVANATSAPEEVGNWEAEANAILAGTKALPVKRTEVATEENAPALTQENRNRLARLAEEAETTTTKNVWENEPAPAASLPVPEAVVQTQPDLGQGPIKRFDTIIGSVYSSYFEKEGEPVPQLLDTDSEDLRKRKLREIDNRTVHFVDIPAGTILFRGERLPDPEKGEDLRNFYRDFLGTIDPTTKKFCIPPNYNVFFYPFPHIAFGANIYGERFNAMQMYVTRKKVTLACMISPATKVRGSPKGYDEYMPIMRCNKVYEFLGDESLLCGSTGEAKTKKLDAMSYDNCLNPIYMNAVKQWTPQNPLIHGWMAIAEGDSLDIKGEGAQRRETVRKGRNTVMGKYLTEMSKRYPNKLSEVLSWMYTDVHGHRGFPEIALHPLTPHPGTETITLDKIDIDEALEFIENNSNRFAYLPLACFTATQTLDGIEGEFKVTNISDADRKMFPREAGKEAEAKAMRDPVRKGIERQLDAYMTKLMTEGIEIPGVGLSKIVFDSRTGFYVLDSFVRVKNPIIFDITKINPTTNDYYQFSYLDVLMSLETPEDRRNVMNYSIVFNKYNPRKVFLPELLFPEGPVVYRSFIFNRPSNYFQLFANLHERFPPDLKKVTDRASFKYRQNKLNNESMRQQGGGRQTRKLRRFLKRVNSNLTVIQNALLD